MDEQRTPRSENCGEGHLRHRDPMLGKKYFSKYKTIKKLGEGSFGKVYKAEYNGDYYALKFENRTNSQSLLENEATIMSYLKGPNIPIIKSFGFSSDFNILVMQLMDRSLEDLFNKKKTFSVKTTAMLGYQMVTVLNYIHDKHIIHRDIKPDNFVMGSGELNAHLYLLDFGLAKKYRSSRTLIQYPMIKKKKLTGTARYASIHALEEWEQSRRDDLESVGYVLIYFLKGYLPWQGLKVKSKEDRYKKILMKKKETSSEELCQGFPVEFKEFVEDTRNLEYDAEPKYEEYKAKFYDLVTKKNGMSFDFIYDWTTESDIRKRKVENIITDIAQSTNCPPSEKKSAYKQVSSLCSKIKDNNNNFNIQCGNNPPGNSNINECCEDPEEGKNVVVDDTDDSNNKQSMCCVIF